jgi:DNA-binding transcriptional LysR family regulator
LRGVHPPHVADYASRHPAPATIDAAQAPCDRARVLDWNDLRYFLAIARAGTLTSAARDLKVEHTTVGRRLSAMESALGTRLFTRGPDGFSLTRAGSEVLPLAQEIAARVEAIERRVAGEDAKIEGVVRLTTSEALSGYLVRQLATLRERHPALFVEILSGNQAFDLLRGEADLAVRVREVSEPELVARKVAVSGWSLYAAPAYLERKGAPSSPEDLRDQDVIGFDKSLSAVPGALWLDAHAEGTRVVMRANSIVAALNATIFGMGLAVLPCFMADPEAALQRLTPRLLGARDVFLVVHPDLARVARVRAVMEFVVEVYSRDAELWRGERAEPRAGL